MFDEHHMHVSQFAKFVVSVFPGLSNSAAKADAGELSQGLDDELHTLWKSNSDKNTDT